MEKRIILVLGGARSGKSDYASKFAQASSESVLFVATAEAGDEEMRTRIEQHRSERPPAWRTLEAPLGVGKAIRAGWRGEKIVILDCMTLLAGNVLGRMSEPYHERTAQAVMDEETQNILDAYREIEAVWVIVSNEVGLGIIPPYPLGRLYRDVLGRTNQRLAAEADEVFFLVSGLAMKLK